MDIVARPEIAPGHCMATLTSEDPKGFLDTLLTPAVVDPRVYLSVSWLEECARKLGFVEGEVCERLERRVADLEAQLAEVDRELDAIHVLKARGYTPARKPGRPSASNKAA